MFKQNCVYFISDRPCKFHKLNKQTCKNCSEYLSVRNSISKSKKKIVIIKLSALGDVLRTTSILKPLFIKYKNPEIYWITDRNAVPLLENIKYIKKIIPFRPDYISFILSIKYDVMINLDLGIDSLAIASMIDAREKIGFWIEPGKKEILKSKNARKWFELSHNDILKKENKKTYQEHILEIVGLKNLKKDDYKIIVNLTDEEKKFARLFAEKNGILDNKIIIGFNTGGGSEWPRKEWPVKNTVKLMKMLVEYAIKKNLNIKLILFGGEKEKERNYNIINQFEIKEKKYLIDAGTSNTLRQFMALINLCDIVITTDTLALHIAVGLGKKVIALFGPTSLNEIELYGNGIRVQTPVKCSVCYNRYCLKTLNCMGSITPECIYSKLKNII